MKVSPEERASTVNRAHVVGVHLNNKVDKAGERFLERAREMNVNGIGFLTEIKPENVQEILEVNPNGVYMVRPYLDPPDASNDKYLDADQLQGYIEQFIAWVQAVLLVSPLFRKLMDEGKIVAAPFNEPNIPVGGKGAEGFPLGEPGMRLLKWAWNEFYDKVKVALPRLQIGSTPMTPGNWDVYFLDPDHRDRPEQSPTWGKHHWYHGPEASYGDPTINHPNNPNATQIERAKQSAILKSMFEKADVIFVHVYPEFVGDENKLWAGLRHKQIAKFLPTNKPWIIKECDVGTQVKPGGVRDQQYRAEHFPEWTEIVEQQTPYVVVYYIWLDGTNHDETWAMNKLADDGGRGVNRPVVRALHDYTKNRPEIPVMTGGTPPPDAPPTNPPVPPTTPPLPPREVINKPAWISFVEPTVPAGSDYYELTRFKFVDEAEAGGKNNIFILDPHNPALKIRVTNTGTGRVDEIALDKPANEPAANVPMYGIGNVYDVEMVGLPSVKVKGHHLPGNRHVCYELTFARRTKPVPETPVPVPPTIPGGLKTHLLAEAERRIVLPFNPDAALMKAITRDNRDVFHPNSPEFYTTFEGKTYVAQRAENGRGVVRVYFAQAGKWNEVSYVERSQV